MPFAIVGYYDKYTDEKIKLLWKGMADIGVDDYLIRSDNNPHFKFAMYEDLDINNVQQELYSMTKTIKKLPVQFKSYSFYPNEKPFISIDLAVSHLILDIQDEIRKKCDKYAKLYDFNYFDQGIWKPDCQLTIEFEKEKLGKAIEYLSNTVLPFDGIVERIGIIEFPPAKQLFSYELI
ncbi:hypothetical protein [Anaeromicropila herbilytica]|uniref:2'-5' RNA ligase n=1 Tax=Anaeromicropila herbilytica TaxID=2785025 RepID=A0A7R7ELJ6_9FIRM|nr:hypothetical protein [Anaeromicropila herbilytica]BCN30826.1 hypothetical protein bsdtb5_21210 [Anaeromicropila herbilytica]